MNYYMFPNISVRNRLLSKAEQYDISYETQSIYDTVWHIGINDSIIIPYRVGRNEINPECSGIQPFNLDDKLAYLCYLSRNQSGYVRYIWDVFSVIRVPVTYHSNITFSDIIHIQANNIDKLLIKYFG